MNVTLQLNPRPDVILKRSKKFTPETIQQITNLVERGKGRIEIAEIIGVTPGTLAVACSKLGISLRRQRWDLGTGPLSSSGKNGSAADLQKLVERIAMLRYDIPDVRMFLENDLRFLEQFR
jgi:transposase-like protein